ncbi:uncharacterized protein LOC143239785 [Tachypleus tridentatus]|uniref:uncharacterized protein LOC143239785 n=1 Tax=Tachypleus tridentatus TaxID=6853 RepID=UPI003FD6AF19
MVTMTIATLFLVVSVQLCTFVVLAQQHKSPKTFTYLSVTDNPSELQNALSPGDSMPEFVRDFLSFRDVPIAGVDYELRPIPIPVPVHYEVPVQRPSEDQKGRSPSELTDKPPLSSHEYSQPGTGHRYIEGSDQRSIPHPRPEVIVAEYPEYNERPTNPEIQEDTKYPQHYISTEPAVEYQAETGPTYKGQPYGTRIRPSEEQSTQNDNTYQLYPPSREVTEQHYPSTDQSSSSQSNSQEVPQTYYEVGQPQFERKPLHEHPGQYARLENSSPPSQPIYYSRQEVPEQLPEQPVSYYNRGDEDNSSGERKYKPPSRQPTYVYETQEGVPEESLTPHYRPEHSVDRNTPQYSVEDPYTDSVQVQYDQRAYPIAEQPKNVPSRYLQQQPQPVYEKEPREGEYQNPSRESYAAGSPLSVQYYDNKNHPDTSVYYHDRRSTDREESKSPTVKNSQFSNAYSPAFSESQTGMFHKIPSSFDALIDTDTSFLEKLKPIEQQRSEQQQREERAYYPKVSSSEGHVESARLPSSTSTKQSSPPYVQDYRYHPQAPTSSVHSPDTHPSFQALSDDSLDHKTTGYTYEDLVNNRRLPGEPIISYRREEDTLPLPQRLLRARKQVFPVPEQEVYEKNGSNPRNSYFYSFHLPRDKELSILDFRTVGKDGKPIKKADRIQGSIQRAVRKLDKRVPEKRKDGSLKGPLERNSELSSSKVSFSEEDVHLSKRTKRNVQYTRTDAMPNKLKSSILAQKYGRSSRHPSVFKFFRVVALAGPTSANQTVLIDSRVFTDKHGSPVQILTETRPHFEKISELGHEQNIETPTCAKNTSLYCLEDEDYPRDVIFDALSSNQKIADLLKSEHLTEEEVPDRHLPKENEDLQCPLMRRKIFPLRMKDTKGLWQTVVNVEDFRQGVWIETCVFLEESIDNEGEFQTMSSECTQNMSVRRLWTYSPKTGFSLDSFWLPSSCTQTE